MDYGNGMSDDLRQYLLDECNSSKTNKNTIIEKPINNKKVFEIESEKNIINNYNYAISISQGNKKNMEDRYIIDTFLDNPIFVLFNGHKGSYVSNFCKNNFMRILKTTNESMETNIDTLDYFYKLFQQTIYNIDKELLIYSMEHTSGCSITIIYILQNYIISINLGDCKSLLVKKNFQFLELTKEHKPYSPLERKRIINAQGTIINNKINNDISVSRALGHFKYKNQKNKKEDQQLIINEPFINLYFRENDDKYIIIANNNIWDVYTNQKIIDYFSNINNVEHIYNIQTISKKIIEFTYKNSNNENVVIIIIKLI